MFYSIIIILLIFFLVNYYLKNCSFSREHFIDSSIEFLSSSSLLSLLEKNEDHYYETFTIYDKRARKIDNIEQYISMIQNSVADFSSSEKQKIINIIRKYIDPFFQTTSFDDFDGMKAANIPWKFGKIIGTSYEAGLPHTRMDVILLPQSYLNKSDFELASLFIHEKVHIYQKKYPDEVERYLRYHSIEKIHKNEPLKRANPDLDNHFYKDKNMTYYVLYNSEYPHSIRDITYQNGSQISEHPFEKMAIDIESKFRMNQK